MMFFLAGAVTKSSNLIVASWEVFQGDECSSEIPCVRFHTNSWILIFSTLEKPFQAESIFKDC